jgi:hypothetical protein
MKIQLGMVVRDRVTGLIGVAENRGDYLHGCSRFCVQPFAKDDGTVPSSTMVDEPQLEMVADRMPVMPSPAEPAVVVPLGAKVSDPISGEKGICTGRALYLNGCVRVLVEPEQSRTASYHRNAFWIDEYRAKILAEEAAPVDLQRRTGGPAISSKY